jgi:hypothetical protein
MKRSFIHYHVYHVSSIGLGLAIVKRKTSKMPEPLVGAVERDIRQGQTHVRKRKRDECYARGTNGPCLRDVLLREKARTRTGRSKTTLLGRGGCPIE